MPPLLLRLEERGVGVNDLALVEATWSSGQTTVDRSSVLLALQRLLAEAGRRRRAWPRTRQAITYSSTRRQSRADLPSLT